MLLQESIPEQRVKHRRAGSGIVVTVRRRGIFLVDHAVQYDDDFEPVQ